MRNARCDPGQARNRSESHKGEGLTPKPAEPLCRPRPGGSSAHPDVSWLTMSKRVWVAYCGGTIGMRRTPRGYAPEPGLLEHELRALPEFRHPQMPFFEVHEYAPLLDSSNMTPREWTTIAGDIAARHDAWDGFVVLHGTDTMAYTASALSFMLENLARPVIVTGSQIPLCEVRNDARQNVIDALMIAAGHEIPEVCLQFGRRLLRGNRAVKVSATGLDAFDSPNHPPLGRTGVDIEIDWPRVRAKPTAPLVLRQLGQPKVAALRIFPGLDAEIVARMTEPPLQGLVLECFGAGNGPDRDLRFLAAVKDAVDRGVVVVIVSQCLAGRVALGEYSSGSALAEAGAISGHDMTAEAAMTKMFHLLSQRLGIDEVKTRMQEDLRGELTIRAARAGTGPGRIVRATGGGPASS